MSPQANTILLALIPKNHVVTSVLDFRPLACCTVFYKTASKILCIRFKPLLQSIVWKEQGAFVEGRWKISLINTVILGMEQYWCVTLLIPKGVLNLITKFCKNFLWNSEEGQRKLVMKSWSSCCVPHTEGGYDIKEVLSWNKSIIIEWLWAIDNNSDSLWSIWNQVYNIKSANFWTMPIRAYHSESWRSILIVRNDLIARAGSLETTRRILSNCTKGGRLKLILIYDHFREKALRISGYRGVWQRAVLPKHSFIMVLAMQGRLATIDKLNQKGTCLVNQCIMCKAANETHTHLFFKCSFNAAVWKGVLQWLAMQDRTLDMRRELRWITNRRVRRDWKPHWYSSCLNAAVYSLWEERNTRIFRVLAFYKCNSEL
ncbi:uncharacterized protein LOC141613907 [Silene latifolia]|uniref:uncharacterized protein LOC141613907 n=1 Tax=Silene latifolia TaxID=37657 RepID=UPI003D784E25